MGTGLRGGRAEAVRWRRWWPLVGLGGVVSGAFCYSSVLFAATEAVAHWGSKPVWTSLAGVPLSAVFFGLCCGSVIWFPLWIAGISGGGLVLLATPEQSTARGARLRRIAFSAATALCSAATAWAIFHALFRVGLCSPGDPGPCVFDFSSPFYDPAVAAPVVLVASALVSWWYAPIAAPAQRDLPGQGSW